MKGTKDIILAKALDMFNEKGIEYVGMRELAAELGLRIGNITYYFPTKDDLVFAISQEYSASNTEIHSTMAVNSLYDFLAKCKKLFENGVRYRCLMLSMEHVMEQNQMVAESYKKVARARQSSIAELIRTLKEGKYIDIGDDDVEWFLVSINSLIGRFWFSEAALVTRRNKLDTYIAYYLKIQVLLFKPYATKKGLSDLERFVSHEQLN